MDHNKKAYMFAPVLGIIYTAKDNTLLDSEENLQSFLKKIQGHAIPKLVKPNTLRDILNIPSRVFNSIHIADSIQLALEEALAFFGSKLKEVLNAVNFVSKFIPSKVVKSYYKDQGYNNHTNLSADLTSKNIQKRILHSLFIKNSNILLSDYTNLLQIYKRIDLDDEIFLDTLKMFSDDYIVKDLRAVFIDFSKNSTLMNLEFFWVLLDYLNVFYSPLEKYVFETKIKYG